MAKSKPPPPKIEKNRYLLVAVFFMAKEAVMKKYKISFRCLGCNRLLAKADGDTEIKCPRCGMINQLKAFTGEVVPAGDDDTSDDDLMEE